jgi:uncharacterized protein (TIGR02217 family)
MLTQAFPDRIARGAVGGVGYSTTVAEAFGGQEDRNKNWPLGRHKFNCSQGLKTDADHQAADAHFRKAKGRAYAFPFKDWTDYELLVANSRLVLISGTTYQVSKVYGADEAGYEEVRPLTLIKSGTLRVYSAGVLKTLGTHYTQDLHAGTITTALGTLTAACEFYIPCRYDFDQKNATLVHRRGNGTRFVRWDNIDIIEVPLEP